MPRKDPQSYVSELHKEGRGTTGRGPFLQAVPLFQRYALSSYALTCAAPSHCRHSGLANSQPAPHARGHPTVALRCEWAASQGVHMDHFQSGSFLIGLVSNWAQF